jgi:hypothetical protein
MGFGGGGFYFGLTARVYISFPFDFGLSVVIIVVVAFDRCLSFNFCHFILALCCRISGR